MSIVESNSHHNATIKQIITNSIGIKEEIKMRSSHQNKILIFLTPQLHEILRSIFSKVQTIQWMDIMSINRILFKLKG